MDSIFHQYYIQPNSGYEYYPTEVDQKSIHREQHNKFDFEYFCKDEFGLNDFVGISTKDNASSQLAYIEEGSGYEYNDYNPVIAYQEIHNNSKAIYRTSHEDKIPLQHKYNINATNNIVPSRSYDVGPAKSHIWKSKLYKNNTSRQHNRHRNGNKNKYHHKHLPTLDLINSASNHVDICIQMKKFLMNTSRNGLRRVHVRLGQNPNIRSEASHYLSKKMYSFRFINFQLIVVYL